MTQDDKTHLEATVAAAAAEITRVRQANALLSEDFQQDPTPEKRDGLKQAAKALTAAREALDTAKAELKVFEKTGSVHGLVENDGKLTGTILVTPKPGWTQQQREAAIEAALDQPLTEAIKGLGVVLAAAPVKYTKERPGRDAEGRIVLDVGGRVEGDRLTPAVSRAAKYAKR